jgi:ribonuclease BN (tRNA processing enzyme)
MKFILLGTRGSRPILTPERLKYGGNTTSYKIVIDGMSPIFIDGGTGIFREGVEITSAGKSNFHAHFLITHTHWDHILAFPFFDPLYKTGTKISIMGPRSEKYDIKALFEHQHARGLIPIPFSRIRHKIAFKELYPDQEFILEKATVKTFRLNHQGLTLGYRISDGQKTVCIITDNAPIRNNHLSVTMKDWKPEDYTTLEQEFTRGLTEFVQNADLIFHDTHFTLESIKGKENWGHSCPEMAVDLAVVANVKQLIIGHHAPEESDGDVDKKVQDAIHYLKAHYPQSALDVCAVSEGATICL